MQKLFDILSLFRKGSEVTNPEAWHDGGNIVALLASVITALVKVAGDYGYGIKLDSSTALAVAGGVVAVVHVVLNNITSKSGGILPAAAERPDSDGNTSSVNGVPIVEDSTPVSESALPPLAATANDGDAQGGNAYFG